jgi:hypothetical protein
MPLVIAAPSFQFQAQGGPIPLNELDTNFQQVINSINPINGYSACFADSSGVANTITVTVTLPQSLSLPNIIGPNGNNPIIQVQVANTTTASAVNLNLAGTGASPTGNKPIINADGSALIPGQIVTGQFIALQYDGISSWRLMSQGNRLPQTSAILTLAAPTTRTSTTVLTNDAILQFAIPVAGTYKIEAIISANYGNPGGVTANLNFSGAITNGVTSLVIAAAIYGGPISATVNNPLINSSGSVVSNFPLNVEAILVAGAAGTVAVAWAQLSSNATPSQFNTGSTMIVTRLA